MRDNPILWAYVDSDGSCEYQIPDEAHHDPELRRRLLTVVAGAEVLRAGGGYANYTIRDQAGANWGHGVMWGDGPNAAYGRGHGGGHTGGGHTGAGHPGYGYGAGQNRQAAPAVNQYYSMRYGAGSPYAYGKMGMGYGGMGYGNMGYGGSMNPYSMRYRPW